VAPSRHHRPHQLGSRLGAGQRALHLCVVQHHDEHARCFAQHQGHADNGVPHLTAPESPAEVLQVMLRLSWHAQDCNAAGVCQAELSSRGRLLARQRLVPPDCAPDCFSGLCLRV